LHFQEGEPASTEPGVSSPRCAARPSPLIGSHVQEPHWKFGTITFAWPACSTEPEKLPSDAIVKLPDHDDDPERVAIAETLLPSLETLTL
jgi:hypothetical protein